jgi:hypothetical protein
MPQDRNRQRTTLTLAPGLVDDIDEYAEESHIGSRSRAVELLTRDALEGEDDDEDETEVAETDPRRPSTPQVADRVAVGNRVTVAMVLLVAGCGALVGVGVAPVFLFGLAQLAVVVGLGSLAVSWYYVGQLAVDAGLVARVATVLRATVADPEDIAETATDGGAD